MSPPPRLCSLLELLQCFYMNKILSFTSFSTKGYCQQSLRWIIAFALIMSVKENWRSATWKFKNVLIYLFNIATNAEDIFLQLEGLYKISECRKILIIIFHCQFKWLNDYTCLMMRKTIKLTAMVIYVTFLNIRYPQKWTWKHIFGPIYSTYD